MNNKNSIAVRRSGRGMALTAAAITFLGFADVSDSSAQRRLNNRGTPEEQEACRPDVFRLCFGAIPDEPRIVACLQHRKEQLSPACRMVIDPPPPPRRKAKPKQHRPRPKH